jgi:cellulose biosynthesis protein BcsQ
MANLQEELDRARDAGADLIFMDAPAHLSDWAIRAAKASDLVIVPSRRDLYQAGDGLWHPPRVRGARAEVAQG